MVWLGVLWPAVLDLFLSITSKFGAFPFPSSNPQSPNQPPKYTNHINFLLTPNIHPIPSHSTTYPNPNPSPKTQETFSISYISTIYGPSSSSSISRSIIYSQPLLLSKNYAYKAASSAISSLLRIQNVICMARSFRPEPLST